MSQKFLLPNLESYLRKEACSLCGELKGLRVGDVAFWDLQTSHVSQCEKCLHIQLDPKLTEESTRLGCFAYYKKEFARVPEKEQRRNQLRNFRRGVLFGRTLKRHQPDVSSVLEFGPGDGFFLRGLRFVFPKVRITVLDIVEDVLKACQANHGYETILGSPDSLVLPTTEKFDLIIARDVIEHVNDIPAMFQNLRKLLKPEGLFHFLTPNGYEDVWGHAMLWSEQKKVSELLINHVNYFEGSSLLNYLGENGFKPVRFYTYKMKDFIRGKGRKRSLRWSRPSQMLSAKKFIDEPIPSTPQVSATQDVWYISKRFPWLTYAISAYHHLDLIRINPRRNRGHEIFGLFRLIPRT